MDEGSSLPVPTPASPGKIRQRRQLFILIACVLIATALWFLRALENEYTTKVDHPVEYINLPANMIALSPLPQRISLEVKGLGFSVLRHNWNFSKTPLTIDIKSLKSVPAKRKKGFIEYLPMNLHYNDFSTQLKDLKVLSIYPDTLLFRFAVKKHRNIKVTAGLIYESGAINIPDSVISIQPDSVAVEGPDLILDTLNSVHTLPIKINKQGGSVNRSIGLEIIDRNVTVTPSKVTISIGKKGR